MSEDPTRLLPNEDSKLILARLDVLIRQVQTLTTEATELKERQAALEEKVDRRLQDTRPIWEAVLAQLSELKERQQRFEQEMLLEMKRTRRDFISALHLESRVNADFRGDVEERLDKLEQRNAA